MHAIRVGFKLWLQLDVAIFVGFEAACIRPVVFA